MPVIGAVPAPTVVVRRKIRSAVRRLFPRAFSTRLERVVERRVHLVDPRDISFVTQADKRVAHLGDGAAGDWDVTETRFETLDVFLAFKAVIDEGADWGSTFFYRRIVGKISSGQPFWGCRTEEEFLQRLHRLGDLYEDIRQHGYSASGSGDEILVNVGRHGDLLFQDGRHRLCIAKLLGLRQVPVRIHIRHWNWLCTKNRILQWARDHGGRVYAPLLHPDLEWIPSHYGHKRFAMIERATRFSSGTVLDLGCNWGYFCDRFESAGFDCTGVDMGAGVVEFLHLIRRARNKRFSVVHASAHEFVTKRPGRYDVVLALGIFHHMIKTQRGLQELRELLERLEMQELFFLPHRTSESQMQGAYWNPTEREFVDFLLAHSTLTRAEPLGAAEDGRTLYKLSA